MPVSEVESTFEKGCLSLMVITGFLVYMGRQDSRIPMSSVILVNDSGGAITGKYVSANDFGPQVRLLPGERTLGWSYLTLHLEANVEVVAEGGKKDILPVTGKLHGGVVVVHFAPKATSAP